MFKQVAPAVLQAYGINYARIDSAQKGYRNESYAVHMATGEVYNLLFFKNEPEILRRIKRADHASALAADQGLPVRVRQDKRLLRVKNGVYAGLYNYLPGNTVPWEALTKKHIKLLGQAMADLHKAWHYESPADNYHVQEELLPLLDRIERYFARDDVQSAMVKKLRVELDADFAAFRRLIKKVSLLPGQQIVHMDMVRGNILFDYPQYDDSWQMDDVALTGVIDFEKAALGHTMFDLARTLAFLLVDSPKPAAKVYRYFLDSGYHKRGGLPVPDSRLLDPLIRLFLLHDFYKFLRHTPYESLQDNRHYARTCEILKAYGMISAKS